MAKITKVEPVVPVVRARKKVAAYARVSVDSERMWHSLSAQVSYYSGLIQNDPGWEFVGVYADYGISGTGTKKRNEFNRMMGDCEAGKIDIILTKSISRFARNTVDLLQAVRHLKELGIEVRFEKENIHSMSGDGELMLSILASFAQEESISISNNVKWGIRKRMQEGILWSHCPIYGYRWVDGTLVIEPEEAEVVRMIYDNYLKGMSAEATEKQLEEMGVRTSKGGRFSSCYIRSILSNVTYTGNLLLQKKFNADPISRKKCVNRGELPQYWVEDTHEAIIDMETYRRVQDEIARRRSLGNFANPHVHTTCFTNKLICANCGARYRRHTARRTNGTYTTWTCALKHEKGVSFCDAGNVPQEALVRSCREALGLSEFDEAVFLKRVDHIMVCKDNLLVFHMSDGTDIPLTWEYASTAKKDSWTPERRKEWGDRRKCKDTNPRSFYEFTGFIKCGCCGANYRSQGQTMADGSRIRYWHCLTPKSQCHNPNIRDEEMKRLVSEVLGLDEFNEAEMDAAMDQATILGDAVTFHFRDGHTESVNRTPMTGKTGKEVR